MIRAGIWLPGLCRAARAAALGLCAAGALAGCAEMEAGLSGRDAEWVRLHGTGDFAILSATPERAVVSADGNAVAIEPAPGLCLSRDSIETSDRSAFLLIGDCVLDAAEGVMPAGAGSLDLPPAMPGIITVSISGDPGFSPRGSGDLDQLETFLETAEGRALLGRGGDGAEVSVADMRRVGDGLYVLVEDRGAAAVPVLAPRFWRAFVEINDRLAVVTVSGFRDSPMPEDEMLRHLSDQVRQLQFANSGPIEAAPVQLVEAPVQLAAAPDGQPGTEPGDTRSEPSAGSAVEGEHAPGPGEALASAAVGGDAAGSAEALASAAGEAAPVPGPTETAAGEPAPGPMPRPVLASTAAGGPELPPAPPRRPGAAAAPNPWEAALAPAGSAAVELVYPAEKASPDTTAPATMPLPPRRADR